MKEGGCIYHVDRRRPKGRKGGWENEEFNKNDLKNLIRSEEVLWRISSLH